MSAYCFSVYLNECFMYDHGVSILVWCIPPFSPGVHILLRRAEKHGCILL